MAEKDQKQEKTAETPGVEARLDRIEAALQQLIKAVEEMNPEPHVATKWFI